MDSGEVRAAEDKEKCMGEGQDAPESPVGQEVFED